MRKTHLKILSWTTLRSIYLNFQPVKGDIRQILNWVTKNLSNVLYSDAVIQSKIMQGKGHCVLVFIELLLSNTLGLSMISILPSSWVLHIDFFDYGKYFYGWVNTEEFEIQNYFKDKKLI